VEEDHDAVGGQMAVRLHVSRTDRVRGGEGGDRVLDDALRVVGNESAMSQHTRSRAGGEPRVAHEGSAGGVAVVAGGLGASPASVRAANALPRPFIASVNSLGMIHSLLDALSLIFGSVCRYW
jgi:hypothetical protein